MSRLKSTDILVVMGAVMMNGFELGPIKSFGPFFIEFQTHLQASAWQSSLVHSLLIGSYFAAGPIAMIMCNIIGFRKTIIIGAISATVGAVACCFARSIVVVQVLAATIGTGCGLGMVPKYTVIGRRFSKKRSLANNVVSMGSALFAIPLPILVQLWNVEYTWRGSMLLLAGLYLNIVPFGMLLTIHEKRAENNGKRKKILNVDLFRDWKFVCFLLICGCDMGSILSISVYLVRFAQFHGFGDYKAASLASILSAGNLIFRPISGYLTSLTRVGPVPIIRPYIFAVTCVVQAVLMTTITLCTREEAIVAIIVSFSICIGCRGALTTTMAADFFGREKLVTSLGMRALSQGIFTAFIPPVMGSIVDATNSYNPPFYGSAILTMFAALFAIIIHKNRDKTTETIAIARLKHCDT